jgi:large-conductance mechanosensitive channel
VESVVTRSCEHGRPKCRSNFAPGGVHIGALLTTLISFLVLAIVVFS